MVHPFRRPVLLIAVLLIVSVALLPALVAAAPAPDDGSPGGAWTLLTRLYMSGTSEGSDPAGYEVYSAFGLEAAVRRDLGQVFAIELDLCPQSREVEFLNGTEPAPNLGSLEIVPFILLGQWRPALGGSVRPHLGAGVALSIIWEKSGDLNATDIPVAIGPALQLGADFPLSPRLVASLELKWHGLTADVDAVDGQPVQLRIHPSLLSAGVGYRF